MAINWKVRIKNKTFWLAIIPATLLFVQAVLALFGVTWDYTVVSEQLVGIVNAFFVVLAILGVVTDPTTKGMCDSEQAMGYDCPKCDDAGEGDSDV